MQIFSHKRGVSLFFLSSFSTEKNKNKTKIFNGFWGRTENKKRDSTSLAKDVLRLLWKVVVPRNTQQHHPNNPKLYTDDVPTHTSRCAAWSYKKESHHHFWGFFFFLCLTRIKKKIKFSLDSYTADRWTRNNITRVPPGGTEGVQRGDGIYL
jgi:hypothetical protein